MAAKKKAKTKSVAKSKKATNTFAKRSKAAKKGWATRRKNVAVAKKEVKKAAKRVRNAQLGLPPEQQTNSRVTVRGKTKRQLEEMVLERERQIEIFQMTHDWVHAMPDEYLSSVDKHVTLEPSRARHLGHLTGEALQLLKDAFEEGMEKFDSVVYQITNWFNENGYPMSVREVYTLWYSP